MTINLPGDLESAIRAAVDAGRFPSADDAMAEAARLLIRELGQEARATPPVNPNDPGPDLILGSIGSMRDAADELDEIVADAYRKRREETPVVAIDPGSDPILGLMRDDPEMMDEIVAEAYRQRRGKTRRDIRKRL